MDQKNLYAAPKANLDVKASKAEYRAAYLRAALMFAFGIYAFFALLFSVFGLAFVVQETTFKSAINFANIACIAGFATQAFLSVRRRETKVAIYALLLFLFGFGTTTAYRMTYIVNGLHATDLSNFLIFGIPAALAYVYAKLPGENRGTE
jgi:hypothetical protein